MVSTSEHTYYPVFLFLTRDTVGNRLQTPHYDKPTSCEHMRCHGPSCGGNSRDQTGWARDEEERSEDEIRLSAKVGKERGEKAKKDANQKAEEEPPRSMIHDDVDNTASITFDETKVEAKIERVSKHRYCYSCQIQIHCGQPNPSLTMSFSTKPSTSPTSTAPAKLKSSADDVIGIHFGYGSLEFECGRVECEALSVMWARARHRMRSIRRRRRPLGRTSGTASAPLWISWRLATVKERERRA
jgi:hypothetical protein